MRKPRLWAIAAITGVVLVGLVAAAASARTSAPGQASRVDQSMRAVAGHRDSTRYTLFDAPYLKAAFKKAGVAGTHPERAQGPAEAEVPGAAVPGPGRKGGPVRPARPRLGRVDHRPAVSGGAKVIDYDRLVVGSKASYYVSFDNPTVGKLMARAHRSDEGEEDLR